MSVSSRVAKTAPRGARRTIRTAPNAVLASTRVQQLAAAPVISTQVARRHRAGVRCFAAAAESLEVSSSTDQEVVRVEVTVPASICEQAYQATMAAVRRDYNVPGFRNNEKVPADMLIKACGGTQQFNMACIEEVMQRTVEEAFQEHAENVIDGTMKVESDATELAASFKRDSALTYVVTAEIGDLGLEFSKPYKGMTIEVDAVLNQHVEDAKVSSAIKRTLKQRGGDLRVAQRPAQAGDSLIISFEAFDKESGQPLPAMAREKHELDTDEEESFFPGVMPQILGMQVGEQRKFDFEFPKPWDPPELAGKSCWVRVKLLEVLEWDLPELTLEICKSVHEGAESVEDFEAKLREAVQLEASTELEARIQSAILATLAETTTIKRIPEQPFMEFARGRFQAQLQEAIQNGMIQQDQVDELIQESVVNGYIEQEREKLEGEFKVVVAMSRIFDTEKLKVDQELLEEQAASLFKEAEQAGNEGVSLDSAREYVADQLRDFSTMAFLQENATVTVKPLPS